MRRYGDGGRVIQAKNQGAITFRSVWGNRRIGFKPTTSAPQWFQYDVRDSVIRTDPANTDVVEGPESYGPHGEAEGTLGYDSFGYRSELTNSALVHLRNRDYDPVSGQFTSRDPLDGVNGTPGVANPYQYADSDPHNRIDRLGLQSTDDDLNSPGPHDFMDWWLVPNRAQEPKPMPVAGGSTDVGLLHRPAGIGWNPCDPWFGSIDFNRCDPVGYYADKYRKEGESFKKGSEELQKMGMGGKRVEGVAPSTMMRMAGFAESAYSALNVGETCLRGVQEFDTAGMGPCSREALGLVFEYGMKSAGLGVVYVPVWQAFEDMYEWVSDKLLVAGMAIDCSCVPPNLDELEATSNEIRSAHFLGLLDRSDGATCWWMWLKRSRSHIHEQTTANLDFRLGVSDGSNAPPS